MNLTLILSYLVSTQGREPYLDDLIKRNFLHWLVFGHVCTGLFQTCYNDRYVCIVQFYYHFK